MAARSAGCGHGVGSFPNLGHTSSVPVLLLDLDNTLIDRDVAFRGAVVEFLRENRLPEQELEWVMAADADGYAPRERVAAAMHHRWGTTVPTGAIEDLLAAGAKGHVRPDPSIDIALRTATRAGWVPVVITNGGSDQQRGKLRNSGLDRLVAGWVISEEVGSRKPEPEIFEAAAATVRMSLRDAWMIGETRIVDRFPEAVGLLPDLGPNSP